MFAELFANSQIFKDLDAEQLEKVVRACDIVELKSGNYLFREGDPGDRLFIIAEGAVRISRNLPGAGEEALTVLKEGACFGEMAVFDGLARSTDAVADTSCLLLSVSRESFEKLLADDQDLATKVLWAVVRMLSQRLRLSNDQLKSIMVMAMF